jgi:hypothetical protein
MSRPYREIGKPFALRTLELLRALQLIRDAIGAIRGGRVYQLVSLSGQLRALLTERTRKADPLLLEMAKALGRSLEIHCMPDVNDPAFPEDLRNGLLLHVSGFPITARRQYEAQVRLEYSQLLNHEIVLFRGKKYTIGDVIDWYANWAGGAHYSRNLPEDFAELLSLNLAGVEPIASALVQIGEATLAVGRDLLKSVIDLEMHAVVVVPRQDLGEVNYLFDSQYQGSNMRLSLFLNKRSMPSFLVSGLQGVAARIDADRLVDWSAPRHLQASVRIEDDLATVLELVLDGERIGRLLVPEPLFVLSDPLDYELYHNRSVDGAPQQFSFGVAQVAMFGAEVAPADRANMLLYFESKRRDPEQPLMFYAPQSYGHAPRGTKNLTMTGPVQRLRVQDVLPDFRAESVPEADGDEEPA